VSAARTDIDIMFGVAIPRIEGEAARRHLQRLLYQVGGQPNPQAVHPCASLFKNLAGLFVVHIQTGGLQYVQDAREKLL